MSTREGPHQGRSRRAFLRDAALAAGGALTVGGTGAQASAWLNEVQSLLGHESYSGGFVGQAFDRGHRLRDLAALPTPTAQRRVDVAIVGGGIAGLAAARALSRAGIDDYQIFELEDETGGNSRGGVVGSFACPWGAHYLPTPGPHADDVAELLTEFGLRREVQGKAVYDEMQLCHSPQERLYIAGGWQDGLLPVRGQDAATFAEYRRFEALIRAARQPGAYVIPTARSSWNEVMLALDRQTFAQWLQAQQITSPALCWYLDYCCRDDYGAGIAQVSAWAGIHYFASRHGFTAPRETGEPDRDFEQDGILTWPEGNAWLARRLAAPHRARTQTGALVLRAEESKTGVEVEVFDVASGQLTRWTARQLILATPLFIAARLLVNPPDPLRTAATELRHAPWLVANLHIDAPLHEHNGNAPLSWDNVLYGSAGLGYVNAMNQSTQPYSGATVLSYYLALGNDSLAGRRALLDGSWAQWCQTIVAELSEAHPDLNTKLRHIDIMRYGHAMAIPTPGVRTSDWLVALREPIGRVAFAHSDLSAYSVFEEAYYWGVRAGERTAQALLRSHSTASIEERTDEIGPSSHSQSRHSGV